MRPAVSTQEPVDVEDDADEMAEDSGTNAKGPLRKGSKVTPEALRAFIRMRRGVFKITSFGSLSEMPDVGGAVTSTLRRMVIHQCDTLERALTSSLSERSEGWRSDELDPRHVPDASGGARADETLDVVFKHSPAAAGEEGVQVQLRLARARRARRRADPLERGGDQGWAVRS